MARLFEQAEKKEPGPVLTAAHLAALEAFREGQGQESTPTSMVINLHGHIGQEGEYRQRSVTIGQARAIDVPAFLAAMDAGDIQTALQTVFNAYANAVTIYYAHAITITYS